MENFFIRYKNAMVLMAVILIQVVVLATQVKGVEGARGSGPSGTRLIRVWTMTAFSPFERVLVSTGHFFRNTWRNYINLHNVRTENRQLQDEVARLRMEQVRLRADAEESTHLRALLEFKERYVGQTLAAEIIGSSGSDFSHMIQVDKGSHAGVKPDMAVITPDGIVGKIKEVSPLSSQVLMINDRESGAGVVLENSRLHGILHGAGQGELQISGVMADEKVEVGEAVVTSGGDGVYPKGLPVGTVTKVAGDSEGGPFLFIKVKPAANLERMEEVLVVTKVADDTPVVAGDATPHRAAEILAQRLPTINKPPDNASGTQAAKSDAGATPPSNAARSTIVGKPPVPAATANANTGDGPIPDGKAKLVSEPKGPIPSADDAAASNVAGSEKKSNAAPVTIVGKPSMAAATANANTGDVAVPNGKAKPVHKPKVSSASGDDATASNVAGSEKKSNAAPVTIVGKPPMPAAPANANAGDAAVPNGKAKPVRRPKVPSASPDPDDVTIRNFADSEKKEKKNQPPPPSDPEKPPR